MVKIRSIPDCGNAPKKEFIKELNFAFAMKDINFLLKNVTEDIKWKLVGDKTIKGKNEFEKSLNKVKNSSISEIVIENILTHGKEGAAYGTIKTENGNIIEFSNLYEFSSAKGTKIKYIKSFTIQSK